MATHLLYEMTDKIPYSMRRLLAYIYGALPSPVKYGKVFWETYNFLNESQLWNKEKLEQHQLSQLSILLHHAYDNVPYYRKVFEAESIKPGDIKSIDDLKKLPYLDKDTFKAHFNKIIAKNIKNIDHLSITHTSGTTGKPLQFYMSPFEKAMEWAFVCHQWSRVGYKPGDPRVEMRGQIIKGKGRVVYDPINRVLRLSPQIEGKEVAIYYLRRMMSFGASFLHGYPSAIATFASIIKRYNITVPFRLKAVLFASEVVHDWEREIVQEVFKCRAFDFYGQTEHVAIAAECEHSHLYHFVPQYGITEIDPKTHEIVATGFLNYVNPFIRYRTTDVVSSPIPSKCKCGREYFPLVERIYGRLEDLIITPERMIISPATLTHPFKDLKMVKETRLIQESINRLTVQIVLWNKQDSKKAFTELKILLKNLQEIFGSSMQIKIEILDEIEKDKSGKFRWIISEVTKGLIEKDLEGVY